MGDGWISSALRANELIGNKAFQPALGKLALEFLGEGKTLAPFQVKCIQYLLCGLPCLVDARPGNTRSTPRRPPPPLSLV